MYDSPKENEYLKTKYLSIRHVKNQVIQKKGTTCKQAVPKPILISICLINNNKFPLYIVLIRIEVIEYSA